MSKKNRPVEPVEVLREEPQLVLVEPNKPVETALTTEQLFGLPAKVEPVLEPGFQLGVRNNPGRSAKRICSQCSKEVPLASLVCPHCMPDYVPRSNVTNVSSPVRAVAVGEYHRWYNPTK